MGKSSDIGPGLKYDEGKPRMGLLPFKALREVAQVLTFGAAKYRANNWQKIEHSRYIDALLRHIGAYLDGEDLDPESGLHHLAHASCNTLFLLWQVLTNGPQDKFGN